MNSLLINGLSSLLVKSSVWLCFHLGLSLGRNSGLVQKPASGPKALEVRFSSGPWWCSRGVQSPWTEASVTSSRLARMEKNHPLLGMCALSCDYHCPDSKFHLLCCVMQLKSGRLRLHDLDTGILHVQAFSRRPYSWQDLVKLSFSFVEFLTACSSCIPKTKGFSFADPKI